MQRQTTSKDVEQELLALRSARDELSTSLAVEKAKVLSLGESLSTEKASSYKEGAQDGRSKAIEEYLSSAECRKREEEVASRAIREFVKSPDFGRLVDGRLELFKASPELERIVEGRVEQFKSSEAFEELVTQRLDAYQDSAEFEELQLTLMKSAGEQILDRFRRKRPDVDLSFLDDSDSEDVEMVEPYQVDGDRGNPQGDAEQEAGGAEAEPEEVQTEQGAVGAEVAPEEFTGGGEGGNGGAE